MLLHTYSLCNEILYTIRVLGLAMCFNSSQSGKTNVYRSSSRILEAQLSLIQGYEILAATLNEILRFYHFSY